MRVISLNVKQMYQKPIILKQSKMVFPVQLIEQPNRVRDKVLCRQCSSCHGCR